MHRTYGSYTEYLDFLSAFQHNNTPIGIATALALNEVVDQAYGRKAKVVRDRIYRNPNLWRFPVGYETLSRLWR